MSKLGFSIVGLLALVNGLAACRASAQMPSGSDERAFFENKIRPVLVKHCYECHSAGADELGGKLRLDARNGLLKGGQSGPALIAGNPGESLLVQALRYEHLEMPPDQPLPESTVNDFASWVRRGAIDPRTGDVTEDDDATVDRDALWSFLPPDVPFIPETEDPQWAWDPLDRFVLARLEAAEQTPTRSASANTLIRRLYVDLIGLPPTVDEVESFIEEHRLHGHIAVERLVDSLLESPQFGERWGRHWLDVARYGESNGDDGLGRNATFPHAWRYRDYVVDAFNSDLPYDRFLTEQIAGDLLPADNAAQRNRQLVATGFLAIGSKPASAMNANFAMDVVDDQVNVVSTAVMGLSVACARCHDHKHDPIPTRDYYAIAGIFTSTETLYGRAGDESLTAPPTELHSLTSAWDPNGSSRQTSGDTPALSENYSQSIDRFGPLVHAKLDAAPDDLAFDGEIAFSPADYAHVEESKLEGELSANGDSYSVTFWFKNDTNNDAQPITAYLFSRAEIGNKELPGDHLGIGGTHDPARTGKLFVFNGNVAKETLGGSTVIPSGSWNHVVLTREGDHIKLHLNGNLEIDGSLTATFGESRGYCLATRSDAFAPLDGDLAEFAIFERAITNDQANELHAASGQPRGVRSLGLAMGVREKAEPADCKIHINGESGKLGPTVPRGFLTIYDELPLGRGTELAASPLAIEADQSGRRQLAAWLTHPDHPQTARVMVNRVWLHLFGQGIVATPDDFGVYGARPSHPELLDHLAGRFVRGGWSIKRLIRDIVLSRTYQLDSHADEQLWKADPDNRLFARHDRRRLDAESLRDSILRASGSLDLRPGQGSAIENTVRLINWPPGEATDLHRESYHRSIYLCMLRHSPPPELAAFDLPDGVNVVGQRGETTLPTQSLFLLNNEFVVGESEKLALSVLSAPELHDAGRVRQVFRRVLQRDPSETESRRSLEHVDAIEASLQASVPQAESRRHKAWASLCQALFASNEFRYVD